MAEATDFSREVENRQSLISASLQSAGIYNESLALNWMAQAQLYSNFWYWFDSRGLQEVTDGPDPKPRYPLEINPIKWVSLKHSGALFGEISEDSVDALVHFRYRNEKNQEDDFTRKTEDMIGQIWSESSGAERMLENALIGQVLGGSVYKVNFWPDPNYSYGVRITTPMPDFFYPVWDSEDKWNLHAAYLGYYITPEEALLKYNVKVDTKKPTTYLEYWDRTTYKVLVDGKPAYANTPQGWRPLSGPNKFGVVPFVYVPHLERAGLFYGMSHVPGILGLTKELNSRFADRGDKVKAQSQDVYSLTNSRVALRTQRMGERLFIVLGNSMPDGKSTPEAKLLETSAVGATGGKEFTDDLWRMIQHDTDTPGVVWGEDEGSQRSSATLEVRFWSLKVHLQRERIMATEGFKRINRIILHMLAKTTQHDPRSLKLRAGVDWAQILPRERIDLVNEMVARKGAELVSTRQALLALSRGEDVATHEQEIKDEKAEAQKAAMEQAAEQAKIKTAQKPAGDQGAPSERKSESA
jgi:hypothetical protein